MNRYIKITIFTLVCSCFNINKMYACDQDPIPVITSNPSAYKIFMNTAGSITLNSNSYDPDDGEPQGSNNGIQKYNWDIYSYSLGDYLEPRYRNVNSSFTFSPSALGLSPGRYDVELNVLDDDHEDEPYNYINGFNYYAATEGDWSGIRSIYVIGIEYLKDQWGEDEHYIPTGTGETFVYSLLPGPGSEWEPDIMCLYIKDASGNYAYSRYLFGSTVNNPDIPLGGSEASLEWNGLGNQGTYNGQPLPPGNYTVTLYINKSGHTAYETNPLKIYAVTNLEWVKYGTNITLYDCPAPNGGKAIFPDRLFPADNYANRRKVYIEATITPPLPNKDVYFSWWDVDDPSTDYWPIDENGSAGNDNFGTGEESLNKTSEKTDSNGKARVIFTVTMRPGDNYRIAASTSQTQLIQMTLPMANNNSPPTGVMLSPMLTTWRVLHVEFDTMNPPDDPDHIEPFGVINRTSAAIYSNSLVSRGAPYWPTDSLHGSVLLPTASNAPNIVNYVNEITFDIEHNTSNAVQVRTNYRTDLFDNDGVNGPDDVGEIFDMSSYIANPSNTPFSINTDDQPLSIPDLSDIIDGMNYYFNEAYIYVEENYALNIHDTFPWQRNSDSETDQFAYVDIPGNSGYWTVCVGFGYEEVTYLEEDCHPYCTQPHQMVRGDNDPENEGLPSGFENCAYIYAGMAEYIPGEKCMVYLENIRDCGYSVPFFVTHEVGHLLGLYHQPWEGGTEWYYLRGLMGWEPTDWYKNYLECDVEAYNNTPDYDDFFSLLDIRYLRETCDY